MDKRKEANMAVKNRLLSSLIELAVIKKLSKVTITELVNKSGVARVSFYRNFESVDEIIEYGIEQMYMRYQEGNPSKMDGFNNKQLFIYTFQFYKEYMDLILAFNSNNLSVSLLDVITNCFIDSYGDMSVNSIHKYELYFYSGALYNMIICWLQNGAKESPEEMANEFYRLVKGNR